MDWLGIFSTVSLAWSVYVMNWVRTLAECECVARRWQLISIGVAYLVMIMYDLFVLSTGRHDFHLYAAFMALTFSISAVTVQYIRKLRATPCICSETGQRRIIWLASIKQLIFIPILFIFFVVHRKW